MTKTLEINKSTRHSKITGDFTESLILYWLSKYGFECAKVDHTGIDLIARNPYSNELMGISVKSRSRRKGTEKEYIGIPNGNFEKVDKACNAFGCVPYFAIVVDAFDAITVYIVSMNKLLSLHPKNKTICPWKMGDNYVESYRRDKEIISFTFNYKTTNWWNDIKKD